MVSWPFTLIYYSLAKRMFIACHWFKKKNRDRACRNDEEYEELFGSFDGDSSSIPSLLLMKQDSDSGR